MTIIKVPKSAKDFITQDPHHPRLTRRDFVARGMATGVMSLVLPKIFLGSALNKAYADASSCNQPVGARGALAQIFCSGGPTMTARFLSDVQADLAASSASVAMNYGVVPGDLMNIGPNLNISKSSPFGATLLAGPGGTYSTAAWLQVLKKISGGGHCGAFNQDDGAGQNLGQVGAFSSFKTSGLNKDLRFGSNATLSPWAMGVPSVGVSRTATPSQLEAAMNMTPAAASTGMNAQTMTNTAAASDSLNGIFGAIFGNSSRKGGTNLATAATCGFYNDSVLANSTYAASLFDPTTISVLNTNIVQNNGGLSSSEQALLASYYQSAVGNAAGVFLGLGDDYHGQSGTSIATSDIEAARAIVMFIAACDLAKTKGSLMMNANGIAIAGNGGANGATNGVIPGVNVNGVSYNAPGAEGDAGGFFNVGQIICYDPAGSPPPLVTTGAVKSADGSITASAVAGTVNDALAGLYLTSFKHLGLDNTKLLAKLQAQGFNTTTNLLF